MVGGWGNIIRVLSVIMVRCDHTGRGHLVYTVYPPLTTFWRIISRWVKNIIVHIIVPLLDGRGRGMLIRDIIHTVLTVGAGFVA